MTATTGTTHNIQVFRVYIKASTDKVWEAITSPEWNGKYGYQMAGEYDLRQGGLYVVKANEQMQQMGMPDVVVDGEVIESDPPNRLVQTYRFNFSPEQTTEGFTTLTWELAAELEGITRLTVTHDVTDAPIAAAMIFADTPLEEGGGGWAWILSDLKSLLEGAAPSTS